MLPFNTQVNAVDPPLHATSSPGSLITAVEIRMFNYVAIYVHNNGIMHRTLLG